MVVEEKFNELFCVSQDPSISEQGGGHGQKGVDFQRYWAMLRIFELKMNGAEDFLILFETFQDVAEFDSEKSPTEVDVYQVKKKDGGEWSFNKLTGLCVPDGRKKKQEPVLSDIQDSPLGKLYRTGIAIKNLGSRVHFVSNAGCDLPLADGGTASYKLCCSLSDLDKKHSGILNEALSLLHADGGKPDLEGIKLRKTPLHPGDPSKFALGAAIEYLAKEMPAHSGQAKSLVEALFTHLSKLGRQTEPVESFEELRLQRGYSMAEFDAALQGLENIPDLQRYFDGMLNELSREGLKPIAKAGIMAGATKYFVNLLGGTFTDEERGLMQYCDSIAQNVADSTPLLPAIEKEVATIMSESEYENIRRTEVFAYLLISITRYATTA